MVPSSSWCSTRPPFWLTTNYACALQSNASWDMTSLRSLTSNTAEYGWQHSRDRKKWLKTSNSIIDLRLISHEYLFFYDEKRSWGSRCYQQTAPCQGMFNISCELQYDLSFYWVYCVLKTSGFFFFFLCPQAKYAEKGTEIADNKLSQVNRNNLQINVFRLEFSTPTSHALDSLLVKTL